MDISRQKTSPLSFLSNGGEMGERIRNFNWSKTPLGAPEHWSSSLQNVVSLLLANRFPMILWWGKHYIQFYNDAYIPVPGLKHPDKALGEPAHRCWKEIWEVIGPLIDTPFNGGEPTWMDDILLKVNRKNFTEETHFTIAYSPVPDTTVASGIGGVLAIVNEITDTIINRRQMETLKELGNNISSTLSENDVYLKTCEALSINYFDIPFSLVYKIESHGTKATLVASSGLTGNDNNFEKEIDLLKTGNDPLNIIRTINENIVVEHIDHNKWSVLPKGNWDIVPENFVQVSIRSANKKMPVAVLVFGLNPYRRFDDGYKNFVQLIADQISLGINNALAFDEERKRAEALAEIDRTKTLFFTNISHEFRTPLTLMLSPLEELLNSKNLGNAERNSIEMAHRNAMRLLKLVNMLLDFSRIESGKQQADYELTDIVLFTKSLASNFEAVIEKAGLQLEVNADAIIQPLYIDRTMWEKIVFNLISNAFKNTLKGKITIGFSAEKNFAVLKITDTGVGISSDELPHLFERFHRVQHTRVRTFEGTGIGLSLVKEFVQLQGGEISVESIEGKGSTFTVKIPLDKEQLSSTQTKEPAYEYEQYTAPLFVDEANSIAENLQAEKNIPVAAQENKNTALPLVMIVDDNTDMRQHIETLLAANFNTVSAANGVEALDKLTHIKPALILSDIMMPVMDGIGLLKEVKSNLQTKNIPVILLTARAGEESKIDGLSIGADDYLVKPFSSKELVARIHAQIMLEEKRSKALRDMYRVFDEAPFAVAALTGKDLVIDYINNYNLEIWQRKREDVIGKPLFEVRPDIRSSVEEIHEEVYRTQKRFLGNRIPITLTRNEKTETGYFNAIIDPMFDENGTLVGQIATSIDVTQEVIAGRKIAESELQLKELASQLEKKVKERTFQLAERNVFVETIIESSKDWIAVYDMDFNILTMNKTCSDALKVDRERIIGRNVYEFFPGLAGTQSEADLLSAMKGATITNDPFFSQITGKYLQNYVTPLRNSEGKIYAVLAIAHDVTDIIVKQQEINDAKNLLEEKNIELKRQNAELTSFSYIASHDLQEPLRKIRTFASRILETGQHEMSEAVMNYFSRIMKATERMQDLIDALLSYSQTNVIGEIQKPTDLVDILIDTKENLREMIEETGTTIEAGELPRLNVIPQQFQQLFTNIISNAIKYGKPGVPPVIKIQAEKIDAVKMESSPQPSPTGWWKISFTDNGIGFDQQYAEKIFELFQRLHGRNEYSGTGIGLSICKKIVENHKGFLTAEGHLGKGATFNVYIPANNI